MTCFGTDKLSLMSDRTRVISKDDGCAVMTYGGGGGG